MTYKEEDIENLKKDFKKDLETLKKIDKKLDEKKDLDSSEEIFLRMHLNPKKLEKKPPFSIMSLLHYCWSFSLKLSGSEHQRSLGDKFTENIFAIFNRYRLSSLTVDKPPKGSQLVNERFVNDLVGFFGKTIRNIGFVKEGHDKILDELEKKLDSSTKFYNDLANFTSITKEGIGSKIVAFLGAGSVTTLVSNLNFLQRGNVESQLSNFKSLIDLGVNNTIGNQTIDKAIKLVHTESSVSNADILVFVFAGIVFMVGLTLFSKSWRVKKIKDLNRTIREEQRIYWKNDYRPEVAECITYFYYDVKALIQKYYSHNAKEILEEFWYEILGEPITKDASENKISEPSKKEIEKFIEEKILPHYRLEHEHQDNVSHTTN